MPTHRTPEARRRATASSHEHRIQREARRHIVGIDARPVDRDDEGNRVDVIDEVAIDLALRGWTRYGAQLSRAELVEAVRVGAARGLGTSTLADLLCLWERQVGYLRAEGRAGQTQAVAA